MIPKTTSLKETGEKKKAEPKSSAPEPAQMNGALGDSNGSTANAVYLSSREPTTVLRWAASWMYGPQHPAGQPCMVAGEAGQLASRVLVAYGSNRKCA
jgi:hypothetical protein